MIIKKTNAKLMFLNSTSVFKTKKSRVSCMNLLMRFRIQNSVHKMARKSAELYGIRWN
jgi:hypothetical protein